MKIDLGGGAYLEPDDRSGGLTRFHKRIVRFKRVPSTLVGNICDLECGHRVLTFGPLTETNGAVLCTQCRDAEAKP